MTKRAALSPEDALRRAMAARTPIGRARIARMGLTGHKRIDREIRALLLRQLYLSHFERRQFARAHQIAEEAIHLDVLHDILHQDAARAAVAGGKLEAGIVHLRKAARRSPASRRSLHWWTLGSMLFLAGRYEEAISAFQRAIRWGTRARPLYRAHLALAELAVARPPGDLKETMQELASAPCGQGYGRFVLGHLAFAVRRWKIARRYLEAFVSSIEGSQKVKAISLEAEVTMSRNTLARITGN